jgi:hypothetical protein
VFLHFLEEQFELAQNLRVLEGNEVLAFRTWVEHRDTLRRLSDELAQIVHPLRWTALSDRQISARSVARLVLWNGSGADRARM